MNIGPIGVGLAVAVVILIALAVYFYRDPPDDPDDDFIRPHY